MVIEGEPTAYDYEELLWGKRRKRKEPSEELLWGKGSAAVTAIFVIAALCVIGTTAYFFVWPAIRPWVQSIGTTSIGDILKNPDQFAGKEVSVVGWLLVRNYFDNENQIVRFYSLTDDQGYSIYFPYLPDENIRAYSYGPKYRITGVVSGSRVVFDYFHTPKTIVVVNPTKAEKIGIV